MATAMGSWGSYELGRHLSLPVRAREIVIARTCARCRCEDEWGVHVAFSAERVALSNDQVASLTKSDSSDEWWRDDSERLLIEAVSALHDSSHIDDELWVRLAQEFNQAQLVTRLFVQG